MRAGDSLHWTALLLGIAAVFWALTAIPGLSGFTAGLALVTGLAAGAIGLLAALRLDGAPRGTAIGGTALVLAAHVLFVVAFVAANPVNFKGDPGTGVNQDPPAFFGAVIDNVGTWIPLLLVVGAVLTFWLLWSMRERGLGIAAILLLVLVLVLTAAGVGDDSDALATVYQTLFALSFLALAAACFVPLFTGATWPDAEPA